jgi:hypothetical protein
MKQRELNAALFALVLSVSRTPSVRAEIDAGLPEDSQTAAVLAEINGMVRSGAKDVQRTSNAITPKIKTRVKSAVGTSRVDMEPVTCSECGTGFNPAAPNARYCSDACRKIVSNRRAVDRKVRRKEREAEEKRPKCRLCAAKFTPERKDITYCQSCRANRPKEVTNNITRTYQKAHPELKQQRDREYRARKKPACLMSCQRCGAQEPFTCSHKRYCASCRIAVDNEHKRAWDRKRAAIYKAAVAMGARA